MKKFLSEIFKWLSPYAFIRNDINNFGRDYKNIDQLIARSDNDSSQDVIVEIATLRSAAIAGILTAILMLTMAAIALWNSGFDDFSILGAIGGILLLLSLYLFGCHYSAYRKINPAYEKLQSIKTKTNHNIEPDFELSKYLFKAECFKYFYALVSLYIGILFFHPESISQFIDQGFSMKVVTSISVLIGMAILAVRSLMASADSKKLRDTGVTYTADIGFPNISTNMMPVYFQAIISCAVFFGMYELYNLGRSEEFSSVQKLVINIGSWGYTLLVAFGLAKTFVFYTEMVSAGEKSQGWFTIIINTLTGTGINLPAPSQSTLSLSLRQTQTVELFVIGSMLVVVAFFMPKNWSQIIAYGAVLLPASLTFACQKIRKELEHYGS